MSQREKLILKEAGMGPIKNVFNIHLEWTILLITPQAAQDLSKKRKTKDPMEYEPKISKFKVVLERCASAHDL